MTGATVSDSMSKALVSHNNLFASNLFTLCMLLLLSVVSCLQAKSVNELSFL